MRPKPRTNSNISLQRHEQRIDAVLSEYARAVPSPGLESRVRTRIAAASHRSFESSRAFRLVLARRLSMGALATATAGLMVVGTVRHSRRILPPNAARSMQSGGASPAGAIHIPTQAIKASGEVQPGNQRRPPHSRAALNNNQGRHSIGSATPRSPYPPEKQSEGPQQ